MDLRRPYRPWIIGTFITLPLLYVVSFGPVCWMDQRNGFARPVISVVYRPVFGVMVRTPISPSSLIRHAIVRYMQLGEPCPMQPVLNPNGTIEDWQVLPACRFEWPGL